MREFELIRRYFAGHDAGPGVVLGVGDDGAVLAVPAGEELVVATDAIVADVHFPADLPARSIGHRALAVNLSDLAAMGATPRWATLALTLPRVDERWIAEFAAGFTALAQKSGTALVGGDTTRGPLAATVTVMGTVPTGQALTRGGARAGDGIYVSGTPGDAAAGLAFVQGKLPTEVVGIQPLVLRFEFPEPRLALGQALRGVATACIDVSDGLLADLGHVLEASGRGATVDVDAVPESVPFELAVPAARRRELQLGGGDDYELVFTAPHAAVDALVKGGAALGAALTRIGTVDAARGLRCVDRDGRAYQPRRTGYEHFG